MKYGCEKSVGFRRSQRGRQMAFMISWECGVLGGVLPNQVIEGNVAEVFVWRTALCASGSFWTAKSQSRPRVHDRGHYHRAGDLQLGCGDLTEGIHSYGLCRAMLGGGGW